MTEFDHLPPMKERLKGVSELRDQFGDKTIPPEALAALGFEYFEDEDGTAGFVSFEAVARRALLAESRRFEHHSTVPFTTISLECSAVTSHMGAKLPAPELRRQLKLFLNAVMDEGYHMDNRSEYGTAKRSILDEVYGAKSDVAELAERYPGLIDEFSEGHFPLNTAATATMDMLWIESEWSQRIEGLMDELRNTASPWPSESNSETVVDLLQAVSSIANDNESAERHFRHCIAESTPAFTRHIRKLAVILYENGFKTVAQQMAAAKTLDEARLVIASAHKDNELATESVIAERDLRARRKQTTEQAEIHALASELAALKTKRKQAQRPLQAIDKILNFPTYHQAATLRKVRSLEQLLITKGSDKSIQLTLDTRPDERGDADPGKLTGDCTAGKPLDFGEHTGLRNVRVLQDGQHIGNIYLLDTKTVEETPVPVWHIDALQVPIRRLDWEKFPNVLINALRPLAQEAGVQGITINSKQYLVSNHDYVSRGFMQYFGTADQWKAHDLALQPSDAVDVCDDASRRCAVSFERYQRECGPGKSSPQGANGEQLYLWHAGLDLV